MSTLSQAKIRRNLKELFQDPEGMVTLLTGALMISDFDDPKTALEEALKTFNGNRAYFLELQKKLPSRLDP
ncbi:MAG: hypothetical protein A2600_01240 [Candidatus Lambdaproteobacteria bacterium RIFOXYD1_FULL_56_27]|uniref:Uncharacterized protein n=1 Tax=Candidatus Lambdaproteobacteria bacterium RIFOXYD2_FULL_56_26 TaxID=1817773 RepID=A0A1F6GS95_9PROT|nr:MAG: hypothetical protein A2557_00355 [Candidatus Lambdaproteobacteria bacterium RIFOXYD2_FULL_56_26]OGH01359.1 MAG: hypothetical protein A2426_13190 [Candidatus Lambdaproteobacteria bacterium RIFOXYC1_FULL_56_13]OGH06900.1 MAG: hypothetical protein A2600_01240 [Candidatus Lambdaproteobacteria bacterium RIFOXYD1_FULL_56_27]